MAEFKKGDTVQLKSGGPIMTIQDLGEYDYIQDGAYCVWFTRGEKSADVFDVAMLKHAKDGEVRVSTL